MRIFSAVVVVALLTGGVGASTGLASASRHSTVTAIDLGVLGGTFSVASAVSPSGQVVGESTTAGGGIHPFFWTQPEGWLISAPSAARSASPPP
jgi:probable HAF family extracellular repeat protein